MWPSGIAQVQRAEAARGPTRRCSHAAVAQVVAPGSELLVAADGRSARWWVDAATDLAPLVELRVLQERHERPGAPAASPNQKCRASGSSSLLASRNERQAQHVAVERGRAIEVGADQRDVVQPRELHPARGSRRSSPEP